MKALALDPSDLEPAFYGFYFSARYPAALLNSPFDLPCQS